MQSEKVIWWRPDLIVKLSTLCVGRDKGKGKEIVVVHGEMMSVEGQHAEKENRCQGSFRLEWEELTDDEHDTTGR